MRRATPAAVAAVCALAVSVSAPVASHADATRWVPAPSDRYQLIISATPTAKQLAGPFQVLELDGFDTPKAVVARVHALGKHAVCYVDVGTWEDWRPDAGSFPRSVLGRPDAGWPGERWLDIRRRAVLLAIMRRRFAMCRAKGFDAVDPDNVDGVENATGFPLTLREQLTYDRDIADLAHEDGMSVALKSYADEAAALEPSFDFVVDEQCSAYRECGELAPFVLHAKAVYDIEYTSSLAFCGSLPFGVDGMAKHLSLDAWVRWCP